MPYITKAIEKMEDAFCVKGLNVIITGGYSGIGLGIAQAYVQAGANVAILGRNLQRARAAAEELGETCHAVKCDVSSLDSCKQAREEVGKIFDHVDVLVNCAGVATAIHFLEDEDLAEWHRVIDTDLHGVANMVYVFAPGMIDHGTGGSIINISSIGGNVPDISQVAYGTSKAAINHLTRMIAVHEAKNGIRCNAVLPGMTATQAVETNLTEDFRRLFLRHVPLGRVGLPEDVASAVVYLASGESSYVTGQLLRVSGGFGLATPLYGELSGKAQRR